MPTDPDIDRHHANRNRSRLRNQREYQARYREKLRIAGTPDREDLAAAALRVIVRLCARDWERCGARWEMVLIKELSSSRYEPRAISEAFRQMLDRELAKTASAGQDLG